MKRTISKCIAISLLAITSSIGVIGSFNKLNNNLTMTNAYVSSDWSGGRGDTSGWTFNQDTMVNKSNNWMGGFALYDKADTTLNFENRPEYTVSVTFKGEDVSASITNMYRGIVIYYLDDSNWLTALAKWNYDDRRTEIQELMLYGEIGGQYYKTSAEETPVEWRDLWVDGNQIPATDSVTLTAQLQTFDSNTDNVIITATSASGTCSKSQFVFSLAKQVPTSVYRNPKVGICSFHNAGPSVISNVTFSNFTFSNQAYDGYTPMIVETGNRVTNAYINEQIKLPSFTATNGRNDILEYTRIVKDPYGNEVEVDKKGRFTPNILGKYTVDVSCYDARFDEYAEPVYYEINIYPQPTDILLFETGARPKEGYLNERVILPSYQYNYDLTCVIRVKDELGNDIQVTDNAFIPTNTGYYFVNISLDHTFIEVNDVNYNLYVFAQRNVNSVTYLKTNNEGLVAFAVFMACLLSITTCAVVPMVIINKNKKHK